MANAKKQKNGKWRIQIYLGRDPSGKQIIKSFTGRTKKEAESLAAEYKSRGVMPTQRTVRVAIREYADAREKILSPATLLNYDAILRRCNKHIPEFLDTRLDAVDGPGFQRAINQLAAVLAPSTVSVTAAIMKAVFLDAGIPVPRCRLPKIPRGETFVPSLALAREVFAAAQGTDLELPIIFAAAGLRAGEICAVHPEDFSGDVLHVCRDMVKTREKKYVEKPPKTLTSDRYVRLPAGVADRVREQGFVTRRTPENLSLWHSSFLKKNGFPHFRLHDWRHFMVSSLHSSGLPDAFIMQMGGWSNERVMKGVYRHLLADGVPEMVEKATACLEELFPSSDGSSGEEAAG